MGRIITEIEFNFIIHSKNISITRFDITTLSDRQIIKIIAYNEMADWAYKILKKDNTICINGYIKGSDVVLKMVNLYWI